MSERAWEGGIRAFGALLILMTVYLVLPFVSDIILALLLVYVALPIRNFIGRTIRHRDAAASVTTALVILAVVLPALVGAVYIYGKTRQGVELLVARGHLDANSTAVALFLQEEFVLQQWDQFMIDFLLADQRPSIDQIRTVASAIGVTSIHLCVFVIVLYVFVRDGPELLAKMLDKVPEPHKQQVREYVHVADVAIYANIVARFSTGVMCGAISAAGLYVLGVGSALMLGVLAGIIFIIPQIGIWILYIPLALYFAWQERVALAISLLLLGGAIGILDNVFYTLLLGDRMMKHGMHPLLSLIGLFGGLLIWGFKGLVLGPVIVAMSQTFVETLVLPRGAEAPAGAPKER